MLFGILALYVQVPELFYLPEVLLDDSEMALEGCETEKMLGMTNSIPTLFTKLYVNLLIC